MSQGEKNEGSVEDSESYSMLGPLGQTAVKAREINGRQLPQARTVSFSRHSLQMPGGPQMSDPVILPLFSPHSAAGLSLWKMSAASTKSTHCAVNVTKRPLG